VEPCAYIYKALESRNRKQKRVRVSRSSHAHQCHNYAEDGDMDWRTHADTFMGKLYSSDHSASCDGLFSEGDLSFKKKKCKPSLTFGLE
jgi:hypothetical protein